MKSLSYLLLVIICLLSVSASQAQVLSDLYRAQLPVVNQSVNQRNKVIEQLFAKVIVKVSGSSQSLTNSMISAQLKQALQYTVEFNFSRVDSILHLNALFNEQLVDQLLKNSGVSIWGSRRPTVMLWLASEDEQEQRILISENSELDYSDKIIAHALNRGLPLLLPVWDLEDQLQVNLTDIWGLFSDKVASANLRYHSDFMIIAKAYRSGVSFRTDWVIYKSPINVDAFDIQPAQIIGSGSDEFATTEQALLAIVDQTSDFFSRQYSVDTQTQSGTIAFNITNVGSIETYVEVSNYLMSLKAIESLQVSMISQGIFTFQLTILGDTQSLLDVIGLDGKLINQSFGFGSQPLLFNWHKNLSKKSDIVATN
ncbi:MAG: DUF2066 domain-containing protein [Gammaproteobacteria bacterium]|nr:DUF2066 domain-containing protein [Gammaproteobacteria bacterium]